MAKKRGRTPQTPVVRLSGGGDGLVRLYEVASRAGVPAQDAIGLFDTLTPYPAVRKTGGHEREVQVCVAADRSRFTVGGETVGAFQLWFTEEVANRIVRDYRE